MDVITLLKKDHKMVKNLFEEFHSIKGNKVQKKADIIAQITEALTVHAQVEEELVYPAFNENRSMKEQVGEALEEHQVAKTLLTELDALQPNEERYNAKVKVLNEYVMHHVKEEEKEIFPEAQKRLSSKRLAALGEEVEARRSELLEGDEDGGQQEGENMEEQDMEALEDMEEEGGLTVEKEKGQRGRHRVA
jgi:hemerythrin superfamily protein